MSTGHTPAWLAEICQPDTEPHDAAQVAAAARRVITQQSAWATDLQRFLGCTAGYAAAVLARLEEYGVVAPADGAGAPSRAVLVRAEDLQATLERLPDGLPA